MKFTDGNWLVREGFAIDGAVQAHEIVSEDGGLTAYLSTTPLPGRGAMINTQLLTVRAHAPREGIIGVSISHFEGGRERGPRFELSRAASPDSFAAIRETDDYAELTSGSLSLRMSKGPQWSMAFYRGEERLTGSAFKSIAHVTGPDGEPYTREELDLTVGESVYGLGERFTSFVKNGQIVDIWNKDGGTSSEQAYKNIPFYLTSRGYGVFVDEPGAVSLEVASEKVKKVQFSLPGETLDYYVVDGPTPKEVLGRYTDLTGKPALPPAWSFGLWLSTSFTTEYDEATVTSFVDGMAERDLPLSVFHFDCFWMKEFHWTDFKWDERVFPDPAGMLKRLKDKGLRVCVWINPYIGQRSRLFREGKERGYLLRKPGGGLWQTNLWQPGMALVDFTNPDACAWYAGYLDELMDMGVDSFKTDFGERIPTDAAYHDGSDPQGMHNYYTFLYNKVVFEAIERKLGQGEAAVFARSATAGGQQFPVHWGGDCYADYESMAESLRGGLSLGLSGFGFWSHDIGGFENTAPAHVFKRWLQFGLLSTHSRLHGSTSYRVPWAYDEESVEVTRTFTRLKMKLMPYLYDTAAEAHEQGVPGMRAMLLEFPDDPAAETLDRQYMLGRSLLVAPIFTESGDVAYYVPEGEWTSLLTGETVPGGRWRKERHGFLSLPLLVRPNTLLALGAEDGRPDYDHADGVELALYALEDGASAEAAVRDLKGAPQLTASVSRSGGTLTLHVSGAGKPLRLTLHGGLPAAASVTGAGARLEDGAVWLSGWGGEATVTVELQA
ncbi:alpha-xylosidase [Paenibacillus albicereus]|uniref:alpha-D-xyloside xylohydrolase n=1 Tax=Paenibacillus albicereus TaxID=2726185 RepID=A0A6H2H1X6_9BACL|nr:alpha-xylosidase [Paenibacillus albicereus]QJC53694.1 alpha-xylosidase [Paenibacillus albicereus]